MPKAIKPSAQWVERICAAHKQSSAAYKQCIVAVQKVGQTLISAKETLPHGEFTKMIEHDLPFNASTAQRLMAIAGDQRIQKAAHVQLLPVAWSTLYELTKLPDAAFEKAVASGAIHKAMTREQAKAIRTKHRDVVIAPPNTAMERDEPTVSPTHESGDAVDRPMRVVASETQPDLPPPDRASQTLSKIERLVCDLEQAVERGDIRRDANFDGGVRALYNRLRSLIADHAPSLSQ